jgi:hypothetical protein
MAEIFLSYSRRNEDFMLRLKDDLRQEGFSVWVDQTGLKRGSPGWQIKIEEEIERAGCLVVVLSPEAKKSEWVRDEIAYAKAFKRPILAVLAKGNKQTAVPINLIVTDWFDARRRYSRMLVELATTIQGYLRGGSPRRAVPTTSSPEVRRRKVEEVVSALSQSGSGKVGRIDIFKGDFLYDENAYRATISPANSSDVLEASRQLEMRGWRLGTQFGPNFGRKFLPRQLQGKQRIQSQNNQSSLLNPKAYVYTWPQVGSEMSEQGRHANEVLRKRVAEELVAANELLGEWPEDIKLDFKAPAKPTRKTLPQEEESGGLLDRFLDFLDDL